MLVDRVSRDALTDLLDGDTRSFAVVRRSAAPTVDDTVRAIDQVHRGRSSLDTEVLGLLLDQCEPSGLAELTEAEREVADLVAGCLRNVKIGKRLCKSERTVEKHVASIFGKLGLCSSRHPDLDRRVAAARIVLAGKAGQELLVDTLDRTPESQE